MGYRISSTRRCRPLVAFSLVLFLAVWLAPGVAYGVPHPGDADGITVVGGAPASNGEWPFVVALVTPGFDSYFGQFCGGTLVGAEWIVTAAHCVEGKGPNEVDVVVGRTDLTSSAGERIAAAAVFLHPGYDDSTKDNDLAMIRLSSPATSGSILELATLIDPGPWAAGTTATTVGWGATNPAGTSYPTILQEIEVDIVTDATCDSLPGSFSADSMICANSPGVALNGVCFGDSGSPLVVPDGSDWLGVGATSWGITPCGSATFPDVWARLPMFRSWMNGREHGLTSGYVSRFSGADRYSTAATVSAAAFPSGAPTVWIATGTDFPDALSAGPAAAATGGPVLLTDPNTLPQATADEVTRLNPSSIFIAGGSTVVSAAVEAQLATIAPVTRFAGADRYATSAAISAATFSGGASTVWVATGNDFPDALAAVPAAATVAGPVLLTDPNALPQATADEVTRLNPSSIMIAGGTGAVSAAVEAQLATLAPVTRASGADRYATAAAVSAIAFASGASTVWVATGTNFPDALSAGPAAAVANGPVLLTLTSVAPTPSISELTRLSPGAVGLSGGEAVLNEAVAATVEPLLDS